MVAGFGWRADWQKIGDWCQNTQIQHQKQRTAFDFATSWVRLKDLSTSKLSTGHSTTTEQHILAVKGVSLSSALSLQDTSRVLLMRLTSHTALEVRSYLWRSSLCCGPRRCAFAPGRRCDTPHSGSHRTGHQSHIRARTRVGISPGRCTQHDQFQPSRRTAGHAHSRSSGRDFPLGWPDLEKQEPHRYSLGCIYKAGASQLGSITPTLVCWK